jgi:hypothetical protein
MKMRFYDRITCSRGCASALREDRRLGLIYGPYTDGTRNADGSWHLIGMEEAAGNSEECIYCNGPLPRGRGARILQGIEQRKQHA